MLPRNLTMNGKGVYSESVSMLKSGLAIQKTTDII